MSLRHVILVSLDRGDGTGYEIANYFDSSLGFFWKASHQQIYKELAKLTEDGMASFKVVHQDGKPSKKVYKITASGRDELRRWLALPVSPAPRKDAFLAKVFAGHLIDPEVLLAELRRHQEIVRNLLDTYKCIETERFPDPENLPLEMQFRYMTLQHGIVTRKAWLKWSRSLEKLIEKQIADRSG